MGWNACENALNRAVCRLRHPGSPLTRPLRALLLGAPLLLTACGEDGACTYVAFEDATCTWVEDGDSLSLRVEGDAGTTASTPIRDDTTCYADSSHGLGEPFACELLELDEGGCDPDTWVADVGGCELEVE